ncbi:MAG TPA: pantoate--beta-alanine ligase [Bacteroidota bacterium]|nr:pantoate--beta-alanine ligase [Bacteroidota bacterium]
MRRIVSATEMQAWADEARRKGERIGLVPTMGSLHEGHLSLIARSRGVCDVTITSIYVNPTQFAPNEDFARYPRDLEKDARLCEGAGTTVLFAPSDSEMYPEGYSTFVNVEGVSSVLEGKFRPTHFRGVATVVAKLLLLTRPHLAFFGQKDAQQCVVVKKMVKELQMGVEIVVAPIVREPDGLALSSRNVYLSPRERAEAIVLHQSLLHATEMVRSGERNAAEIVKAMKEMIQQKQSASIDYVEIVHTETLVPLERLQPGLPSLALLAVRFGRTRLIDNAFLTVS